ncbi:MAG: helix-turn-helix transcriptional regulator [Methanobacteriota archaeon]|nr:MAG: helix-turn-helix transcriptional regulator [Euryarchaeota archaeon]
MMNAYELSKLLIDEYSTKILTCASDRPRTVQEMCEKMDIPVTQGYRRVNSLVAEGLLSCEGKVLTPRGKWTKLYVSQVRRAQVIFDEGKVRLKFELKTGQVMWSDDWEPTAAV